MAKYQWFFDESGVLTPCDPKVDNSTKLEFAPETGEMFYRAKLNGTLSFRFEFADILAKGFGYTHIVVLQRYNENDGWVEVWRGRFTLTDCTINYDTKTIEVTPTTIDRYTNILDELETEYNLVKLAPQMQPVNILIRPLLQLYEIRDSKISNYVGNNYFEKDCESVGRNDINQYKFGFQKQYISAEITFTNNWGSPFDYRNGKTITYVGELIYGGLPQESTRVYGQYWDGSQFQTDSMRVRIAQLGSVTDFLFYGNPDLPGQDQQSLVNAEFEAYGMGTVPTSVTIYANLIADARVQWDMICARILVQTDLDSITIGGNTYTIDEIPANDMAGSNFNYNKTLWADVIEVNISAEYSDTPTEWGQNYDDKYFIKPADTPTTRWMPVGQSLWKYFSIWYRVNNSALMYEINNQLTATKNIKDCYSLSNTISKLMQKAGWNGQYFISGVWGSQNYVGANFLPVITPKSNVISSYYDTPAQNAPISLAKIFQMLKQAYKIYWYIDENNNVHVEHISYFMNGNWYEPQPQQLVDLETTLHTRTKHSKAYGQNVVKFTKTNMPGAYKFGWADVQTRPFDGYDIKCLDPYVDKGSQDENNVGDFDTDVDYVLSSPNDVSKDGFFLFALPKIGGSYSHTLVLEKLQITDENGESYEVEIQNADGAFCKIHKTFWRYDMPCENLQINNQADTAITTGRFKTQSVEFADLTMADIIENVDNCVKLIRTQQGEGGISKLSVNLNSLASSADLVFTLFGRKYYLKGAALAGSFTITLNGEQITINVENNRFVYGYTEPINELSFKNTNVVSVDFADTDKLDELTSADEMFKNCVELVAVDFSNKTFGAVTSASDMFAGCVQLSQLIVPTTESWKPDVDFTDCPALTLESFDAFITKYLYVYESGVHTITPNSTFWNGLAPETQTDLMNKATAKGWQIGIPAQYSLSGTSTGSTVYVTINGSPVEISVSGGVWQYDYNTPITSISFLNDTNVTTIDFTNSDLLAGVSSLNDAFKGCSGLVSVDFTGCDLSNVATAADAFAGCSSLTTITADSGSWMPDVDLSDSAMVYSDMVATIGILYSYNSGVHTITFNSTTWDALSVAQQQTIFDAAQLKYWTTNAVMVVYVVRGTSSNVNGQETFSAIFIKDDSLTPSARENIVCDVDGNGNFEFTYHGKKFYDTRYFSNDKTTLLSIDFTDADDFSRLIYLSQEAQGMFKGCTNLASVNFGNRTFENVIRADVLFRECSSLTSVNLSSATFASLGSANHMFDACGATSIDLSSATFANLTTALQMFSNMPNITSLDLSSATFASLQNANEMFLQCKATTIDMRNATFGSLSTAYHMFYQATNMVTLRFDKANWITATNTQGSFRYTNAFTTFVCNTINCNVNPSASGSTILMNMPESPYTYQSMLNFVNWLSDKTGYSASTITFKTSAWNALSAAEQSTLVGIANGKNWNLAH